MNVRLLMAEAVRELPAMLKNRKSYEGVIRQTRWTEGPIFLVGNGASRLAGLAAARIFEWLLGWPVMVRDPVELIRYTLPTLQARSTLIAVSPSGADENLLEAVERAQKRGAAVMAITRYPESPLAKVARSVFLFASAEEAGPALKSIWLEHTALHYIACLVASFFNPRHPLAGTWELEFDGLAGHLEWIYANLTDAVRSFAAAVRSAQELLLAGGGLYHPSALQGTRLAWELSVGGVHALAPADLLEGAPAKPARADAALLLSGSGCRVKKTIHGLAVRLHAEKVRVLSVTDGNDQELVRRSDMAVLTPALSEATGPLVALAFLQWAIVQVSQVKTGQPAGGPEQPYLGPVI